MRKIDIEFTRKKGSEHNYSIYERFDKEGSYLALWQELKTMQVNKNRVLLERENPRNTNIFI